MTTSIVIAIARFLVSGNLHCGCLRPIDLLIAGERIDEVRRAARTFGEQCCA